MTGTRRGSGGLLTGAVVAASALLALDLVHMHLLSGQPAAVSTTNLVVWGALTATGLAVAALLLPLTAALSASVEALARLASRLRPARGRPRLARALAVSAGLLPPVAAFAWLLFQGRGMARVPFATTLGPLAATLAALAATLVGWLVVEAVAAGGRAAKGAGWALLAGLLAGLFLADARLFVGLYSFIHAALGLVALATAVVFARALLPARAGPGPARRRARLLLLGGAVAASLAAGAVGVSLLRASPEARADLLERSLYASRVVRLVARVVPVGGAPAIAAEPLTLAAVEASYLGSRRPLSVPDPRPDILLISIDAVNVDRFPGRGYARDVMPSIAGLLPEGTRFDHAYTTVPETQYALPGLIMSTTRDLGPAAAVRESGATIATELRRAGYSTHWVYEAQDLFQGGGVLNDLQFEGFDGRYGIDDNRPYAVSERNIEILARSGDRPVFIWTHIFAPHHPYDPPAEFAVFGRSTSDRYDGELRAADAYVGRVLDYLRDQGRMDRTVVVITADHGEWSGEGGRFGHGADVLQRTVGVPLLFTGPGIERGRVVDDPVSILDIAPTVVELAGVPPAETFEGASLAPALRGERLERGLVLAFTEGRGSTAAFLGDYKLVFNRDRSVVRLYDVRHDPEESHDLAASDPGRVRSMLAEVAALDLDRLVAERVRTDGRERALDRYALETADPEGDDAERALAARALALLRSPRAPEVLVGLLGDETLPAPIRHRLAESLAAVGAGGSGEPALALARRDRDPVVRVLAVRSLARTTLATGVVEELSASRDVHERRAAASLLESDRARPGAEASARLLEDPDPLVRALALAALGRLAVPDREAALARGLADPDRAVRLAAAERCGAGPARGCLERLLERVEASPDLAERLALLEAARGALERAPERWAGLLDGPPPQRALAYAGLARTDRFDDLLLGRLAAERDDRAREALIRAVGSRRLRAAAPALVLQHGGDNFALAQAATDALLEIGPRAEDVPAILEVFPRTLQMQTKLNLLRVLGAVPSISDPRVYELAERMRATPRMDHNLMRALVEVYSRLEDPRAASLRVDNLLYTNFGYQFWLYGYSLRPERPVAGGQVTLKMLWSIRWNQPRGTFNFIHLLGGRAQVPIDRREVAGLPVPRWPTCRIMVDEVTFEVPEEARRLRILTGWVRGGRLPVVYGEQDGQNRGVVAEVELAPPGGTAGAGGD